MRRLPLLAACLALVLPLVAQPLPKSANYESWHTGAAGDFTPSAERSTRGGLLLAGGAGDVEPAWRWFVDCAAGGDIVVLRASGSDGYQSFIHDKIGGVASVTSILFKNADAARDPAVLARIAAAEGIFMAGGDQALYVQFWKDTPVGAALNAHIAAGKPIGGTSAGLAVLGQYYFSALNDSVTSEEALRNPFHEKVTLGDAFLASPPLIGVITDTHFMARKRLGRLIAFLARLDAQHPQARRLVGLGVDEGTAVCVEPDGTAKVHTFKAGSAWLVQLDGPPAKLVAGEPLQARATVVGLGPDSSLNLRTLAVAAPTALDRVEVAEGRLKRLK